MSKRNLFVLVLCPLVLASCTTADLCNSYTFNPPWKPNPACVDVGGGKYVLRTDQEKFDSQKSLFIFDSPKYGVSVGYPSGWIKKEMPEQNGLAVHFYPSAEARRGDLWLKGKPVYAKVSVFVEPNPGASLMAFKEGFLDAQRQGTDKFSILSEKQTSIGGTEAIEVYSTGSWVINQNPMELKAWLVLTMKNGYGYAFSYANEATDFDALLSDAKKVYASLSLQDAQPSR